VRPELVHPCIICSVFKIAYNNPQARNDMKANNECENEVDQSFEADAYVEEILHVLQELASLFYYFQYSEEPGQFYEFVHSADSCDSHHAVDVLLLATNLAAQNSIEGEYGY